MTRVVVAGGTEIERAALCSILHTDPSVETATLGPSLTHAVGGVKRLQPELVALLTSQAPAEAIEAARRIMAEIPRPIVLVSAVRIEDTRDILARSGALAVIDVPVGEAERRRFVTTLKAMAEVKVVRRWQREMPVARPFSRNLTRGEGQIVAIASSTGGPGALQHIFSELPGDFAAPILVVQHIAGGFADSLVRSLGTTALTIKLAQDGETLKPATVYIAPDNRHLGVSPRNTVMLSEDAPIEGFRPSATYLFEAAAKAFGPQLTAVMLTGMGRDGVAGLPLVRALGGTVIAQDRETSTVFGMPKVAIENGFVDRVLPLAAIARELARSTAMEGVSA
ncbi:MAG TPA: chemotaxis protein CheB [Rhizomicrobium sp.]|jgi:two-component system chemotaxis response regulator CheB|nr:chemotaxis protein CheB [Rhizomicrobium sp.]